MVAYAFYENDARILQYAKALIGRGDSVDVVALRRQDQKEFESVDGVNVYRVQCRTVNETRRISYLLRILFFFLRSASFLLKQQLRKRYDLIHIHSVPDFLVFAALPAKLSRTPVILDIHDILPEFYASKFGATENSILFRSLLLVEKLSAAFADYVIVANHLWRDRLAARSVRGERCAVICNYPDPELFVPRPKRRLDGAFRILYPGTLNEHQGLDIAIRAFAKVVNQIPGAEFQIYGEGPAKPALVRLAMELGLDGRVVFRGFIPVAEIAQVMADCDLAVVPKKASSKFGNEAASTKIWEFMALGVPVIVSRTRVDTFYFNDSVVKFFESENEDDLAEAILTLYRDRALRERLTANARKLVEENNWHVKKREYLGLVDSLLRGARSDRPARGAQPQ